MSDHHLRLVFHSKANSKSFHYFLLNFFAETVLDELSAKLYFSGAQEAKKFFPKSPDLERTFKVTSMAYASFHSIILARND